MKKGNIVLIGILVVLVFALVWGISTNNSLVTLQEEVNLKAGQIQTTLQRRSDLIPNLVETVKGYAKHESETLESVVAARGAAVSAKTPEAKAAAEGTLNNALSRLMVISESYPELKANANFVDLQKQLQQMESEIANSRKYYNGVVKTYNIKCQSIPSNLVASMAHFTVKPLFEITNEVERANVKVQF